VDEEGRTRIQDVLPGESCERVLSYMNYDKDELLDGIWRQLRRAAERKKVKEPEAKAIREALVNGSIVVGVHANNDRAALAKQLLELSGGEALRAA